MSYETADGLGRIAATAAVLAGGRSLRMGTDKALLPLEGKPMVVRQVELLQTAFERVLVVTNSETTRETLGSVPSVSDLIPDQGPIGGLHAALSAAPTEWILAIGCDMPFVNVGFARHLFELTEGFDIVAPSSGELLETMHTYYSRRCLPAIERQISRGERKLIRFFHDLRVRTVPVEVAQGYDPGLRMFMNVNTPEEFEVVAGMKVI